MDEIAEKEMNRNMFDDHSDLAKDEEAEMQPAVQSTERICGQIEEKELNEKVAGNLSGGICRKPEGIAFSGEDKFLAAGALLFGMLFVWLFYDKYPGISIPIFVGAFYLLLFAYVRPVPAKDAKFGWFLTIPVFLISLTYAVFGNKALMLLDIPALAVLIVLQTLLITGVNAFNWHSPGIIIDLLFGMTARCLLHVIKPFGMLAILFERRSSGKDGRSAGFRVLIGLAVSIPFLIILLPLLSSADMVFGKLVEKLPNLLGNININEVVGRTVVALVIFFLSFSYLWSLGHKERPAGGIAGGMTPIAPEQKRHWDPVTVITMTATIDILYMIFVVIQFAYLFGSSGLPDGFTYAEYARRGFFELIIVSLINIALLASALTYTKKGGAGHNIVFRALNSVMIGCTVVMLISAHYRMSLYEQAYGFTFLRIMTHAFMVFLLVLFIITLARVWIESLPLLKPYIIAAIIAFTAINYINADEIIAKKNIERYYATKNIDIEYFATLSNSVADDLKRLAEDKDPNVSARAAEMLEQRKNELLKINRNWQSFNLTNYLAQKDLRNSP